MLLLPLLPQGDRERSLGLPISPLADRSTSQGVTKAQIGFYEFIALPLVHNLCTVFPMLRLGPMKGMKNNYNMLKEQAALAKGIDSSVTVKGPVKGSGSSITIKGVVKGSDASSTLKGVVSHPSVKAV